MRFRSFCRTSTCRYALFGIVFGFCFPVVAISFDVVLHYGMRLNPDSVIRVHNMNPIHFIIDSAPIFLGIAFGVAGYYQEKGKILNRSLRMQANNLVSSNARLKDALDEVHQAQDLLVKAEKLASLGQLTAGIAHELRNPLNFINNFSESGLELIIEMREAKTEPEKEEVLEMINGNFKIIHEHGNRANNILESMMMLARSGKVERRVSDINQVSKDAANIAYHGMSSNIIGFKCDFQMNLAPDLPKVFIVYEDISRVILNILTNAFYAVNERKKSEGSQYKAQVILSTSLNKTKLLSGKECVQITIRDNGTGIPDKLKEQIFNPFFTTKPSGEGTGLGLSISNDIIAVHGGEMQVNSRVNEFTEFSITLPVN